MIIRHPKVIISPQKGSFPPRNHIYLTFSFSKMIYALLSKIVASRIYAILWAKSLRMPGLGDGGGQPNLGNAWILGVSVPGTPPLVWNVSQALFLYFCICSFVHLCICVLVYLFMSTCLLFLWRISLLIRFHSCLLYLAAASHCKAAAE